MINRNKLTELQQNFYNRIVAALHKLEKKIFIPGGIDREEAKELFGLVGDNEVELFYVNFSSYSIGAGFGGSNLQVEYFYGKNEIQRKQLLLSEKKEEILRGYHGTSDVEATEYVHDYIAGTVRYDFAAANRKDAGKAATIEGVLLEKMAVCVGIARTARYLLKELGVTSLVVCGTSLSEEENVFTMGDENHAWNLNMLSNGVYHMDITWDIKEASPLMTVLHKYCNIDEGMAIEQHDWDMVQYPRARKNEANYYVRRGLYFRNRQSLLKYAKNCIEQEKREIGFCLDPCAGFPDDHGNAIIQQIMNQSLTITGRKRVNLRYLYDDRLLIVTIILEYE